jgi:diacylglycerol O-acyltransferase / wax synthase
MTGVDNTLTYMDQASFLALRALGRGPIMQFVWIYERDVDIDGLRRFQHNLGYGLLGRQIDTSPLPFGRHRWVSSPASAELDIDAADRPRAEVWAWADARICQPIDPERGPAWRLAIQPLTGGGAAVSLVVSHSVADALGLSLSIADAAVGTRRELGYPQPGSRSLRQALAQDIRQSARSAPDVARAVAAALRVALASRDDLAASAKSAAPVVRPGSEQPDLVPTVAIYIDLDQWDDRAQQLGGTSNSLFAGFASRLGQTLGRLDQDGLATLSCPVSGRVEGDTRANALAAITVLADPAKVSTGLGELRASIKQALASLSDAAAELLAPLPLTPFTPKFLVRRLESMVLTVGLPIGCSNLGELDPAVNRPDGTDADFVSFRMVEPCVTTEFLEGLGGHLYLASGRVHGRIFITVAAWTIGRPNSKEDLRESVRRTLADLNLSGIVE